MRWLAGCLLLLAVLSCGEARRAPPGGDRVLFLVPADGETPEDPPPEVDARAFVEVAADPLARQRGLMHRERLLPDTGMLFVYPEEREREFWMKNTRIPLSIAYAAADGRIVHIAAMAPGAGTPDHELPRYPSRAPAKYAVEMELGWFAGRGIRVGDRIRLHPDLAAVPVR